MPNQKTAECDNQKVVTALENLLEAMLDRALMRSGDRMERMLAMLARSSPSLICEIEGGNAIIRYATPELNEQFGYVDGELTGRSIDVLIPAGVKELHIRHVADYAENPRHRHMGSAGMNLAGVKKGGQEVPVQVSLFPCYEDGKLYVAATVFVVPPEGRGA